MGTRTGLALAAVTLVALMTWLAATANSQVGQPTFVLPGARGMVGGRGVRASPLTVAQTQARETLPGSTAVCCVVLLGLLGRAAAKRTRGAKVGLHAIAGRHNLYPGRKGMPPMINRRIAKDIEKFQTAQFLKKHNTASKVEDLMKKWLRGRFQVTWTSDTYTDLMYFEQWKKGDENNRVGPNPNSPIDSRKYMEPSKFKKLELANWEMPTEYTRAVTLQEMVQAGMQYGHSAKIWNKKMLKYIYSEYDGSHVFDLVQSAAAMNRACYYVMEAASRGATFLFTGTKEQARPLIKQYAQAAGAHYCDNRFVGGLFTNSGLVAARIEEMKKLLAEQGQGAQNTMMRTSSRRLILKELKLNRLIRRFEGVADMERLPDILIAVDQAKERGAIAEADICGIPTICLVDSNNDPALVDIPVPGNCSGTRSIELFLSKLADAINQGKRLLETTGMPQDPEPEFDPWLFRGSERDRQLRRRSKRQAWHKQFYGSYEKFKELCPLGKIPVMPKFRIFEYPKRRPRKSEFTEPNAAEASAIILFNDRGQS